MAFACDNPGSGRVVRVDASMITSKPAINDHFKTGHQPGSKTVVNEIVLAESPTVGEGMPYRMIDVTDREEILNELTSPDVSAQMKLLSWSGAKDSVLDDLRERSHTGDQ